MDWNLYKHNGFRHCIQKRTLSICNVLRFGCICPLQLPEEKRDHFDFNVSDTLKDLRHHVEFRVSFRLAATARQNFIFI